MMKSRDKGITEITRSDLRALLFWAALGVSKSKGGAYGRDIENIITSYADFLKFELPVQPSFKQPRPR